MSSKTLLDKVRQIQQEKNEKIIPENLPNNVTVYGVSGGVVDVRNSSLDISQEGAQLVKHIESSTGEDWYAAEVTGLSAYDGGNGVIVGANNLIQLPLDAPDIANVIGLTANKIKKDETILGVTGTYEGTSVTENQIVDIDSLSAIFVTTRKDILRTRNLGSVDGFGTIYSNTSPYIYYDKSNKIWKLSIGIYFSEILSTRKLLYITFADLEGQYFGYSWAYIEPTTKSYQRVAFDQGNMLNKNGQVMSDEEILQLGYLSSAYDTEPTSN